MVTKNDNKHNKRNETNENSIKREENKKSHLGMYWLNRQKEILFINSDI